MSARRGCANPTIAALGTVAPAAERMSLPSMLAIIRTTSHSRHRPRLIGRTHPRGTWPIRYPPLSSFSGEWDFGWILDGRATQYVWRGHLKDRDPGQFGVGTSLSLYNAQQRLRRVVFMAPSSGNA